MGVKKGQEDHALDAAAFSASQNKLLGPVKGQFGYYVFEVTKITKATQQTLAQATPLIEQTLKSQGQSTLSDRGGQPGPQALDQPDELPVAVRDGRLPWVQGAGHARHADGTLDHGSADADGAVHHYFELNDAVGGSTGNGQRFRKPRLVSSGASRPEVAQALERLEAITRRLRAECPWDREQDERSIVPHTLEEAYELADAAMRGDDAKLVDELGDVLFQVHFLSLLLEERGAGDLAQVADGCAEKLIRRHPHVFGRGGAQPTAAEVLRNWDQIKRGETGREPGVFGEVPENLPAPLYARKVQRRAASSGFDFPDVAPVLDAVREELAEVEAAHGREEQFRELGDLLFATVNLARKLRVDPELALRAVSGPLPGAGGGRRATRRIRWPELERSAPG